MLCFVRYRGKVLLYNERVEELNRVTTQRDDVKKQHDEWRKKRHDSLLIFNGLYIPTSAVPHKLN